MSNNLPVNCSLALIKRGNHYLGVSRKDRPSDIGLPGGKREPGESFHDCLVREVLEETGYHVRVESNPWFKAVEGEYNCITMIATIINHEPEQIAPSETGVVGFFSKQHFLDGSFGEYNKKMFEHFEAQTRD